MDATDDGVHGGIGGESGSLELDASELCVPRGEGSDAAPSDVGGRRRLEPDGARVEGVDTIRIEAVASGEGATGRIPSEVRASLLLEGRLLLFRPAS